VGDRACRRKPETGPEPLPRPAGRVELRAGFPLARAARFPPGRAWPDRLRLNGGVERAGGRFHPRPDWRRATADELALLVADMPGPATPSPAPPAGTAPSAAAGEPPPRRLEAGVLAIPLRLRRAWWEEAGADRPRPDPDASYHRFAADLLDFLRFKDLPLPARCEVEVMASRPDQPGTRLDADGRLSGLAFASGRPSGSERRTLATINLGDEATHVVLLNLPAEVMRARLAGGGESAACSLPLEALAVRFFDAFESYPLVRLRLDPGEGLWFPEADVAHDGWTGDKQEVDVVLAIREGLPAPEGELGPASGPPR
jgi:hypothetical protein